MTDYVAAFLNGRGRKRYGRFGVSNSPTSLPQRRRMQATSSSPPIEVHLSNVNAGENVEVNGVLVDNGLTNQEAIAPMNDVALRIKNAYLVKFTTKQKEHISVLTKVVEKYQEEEKLPHCCQIPYVKKMMTNVACKLLIGHYSFSTIYPCEDIIMECLLASFQVPLDDEATRSTFQREWTIYKKGEKGLRGVVCDNIILRRGNTTRELKSHFFTLLGLPKPPPQSDEEAQEEWKRKVQEVKIENKWRTSHDTGAFDPYGSVALHGAISYVMLGRCYSSTTPVQITLEQAGFFFHVMELALNFKTLSEGRLTSQICFMKIKEEEIKQNLHLMHRIYIVEKGQVEVEEDVIPESLP